MRLQFVSDLALIGPIDELAAADLDRQRASALHGQFEIVDRGRVPGWVGAVVHRDIVAQRDQVLSERRCFRSFGSYSPEFRRFKRADQVNLFALPRHILSQHVITGIRIFRTRLGGLQRFQ